jgi:hypothetical protein
MDAALVTAWRAICQELAPAFSSPTFVTFLHIATGWVLCRSRPTVTNLIGTIGESLLGHVAKHWTVYERFFYRAAWSLPRLSQLLLTRLVMPLVDAQGGETKAPVELIFDGTTCGRSGRHVAYAGYFKDASASNTLKTVVHWSHQWLIGCLVLRPARWPNWALALPVLFALYRKKIDGDRQHPFATIQQMAAQMIVQTRQALPDRMIWACGDGQFAARDVVAALDRQSNLVSRLRSDAALHDLPARAGGGGSHRKPRGRPRKKGQRLPTPKTFAQRRGHRWRTIRVRKGGRLIQRQVLPIVCLWYHVCREQPIKLLIVRDPAGKQADDFLFCTDPKESDVNIAERFYARWTIEEAIKDGKQLGGFEQTQGWCPRTVERQAPLALIVQTLVKVWYLTRGVTATQVQPQGAQVCGWLNEKTHPSYLDMLATLRRVLWNDRIKLNSIPRGRVRKILQTLYFTLCAAA